MVLYPYWERASNALYLTVNYSGYGAVRLSGGNVPSGWTGKLEPGQSFNFIFQPYEGYYVYSILLAGWYRNVQYGNQFMVTYDMLQGQNQVMTVRFESIYLPPKTGDDGNVALWAMLALLAALGAGTVIYRLKKDPFGLIKVLCLLLAISLVPCICGTDANAILDASTVFGGDANKIEQPVVPSTPTPQTFPSDNTSRETVNPSAILPSSSTYINTYGTSSLSDEELMEACKEFEAYFTEQVFKNIKAILDEAGYTFQDVVKSTCLLSTMDNFGAMNEVYGRYYPQNSPAAFLTA